MMGAETLRGGRSRVAIGIKGYDLVAVLVHGAGDLGGDGEEVRDPDRVKVPQLQLGTRRVQLVRGAGRGGTPSHAGGGVKFPQLQLRTMVIRDECAAAAAAAAAAATAAAAAATTEGESRAIT